jgi:hypothetical protein
MRHRFAIGAALPAHKGEIAMAITYKDHEPPNIRLQPATLGNEGAVVHLAGLPVTVGANETAGRHYYLCCGCGRTLFRRYKPNREALAHTFRCRCGETNAFAKEAAAAGVKQTAPVT